MRQKELNCLLPLNVILYLTADLKKKKYNSLLKPLYITVIEINMITIILQTYQ